MNFGVAAVRDAPRGAHTQSTAERTDTPHAHTCKEGSEQQQEQGLRRWRRTPTHDAVHTQTRRPRYRHCSRAKTHPRCLACPAAQPAPFESAVVVAVSGGSVHAACLRHARHARTRSVAAAPATLTRRTCQPRRLICVCFTPHAYRHIRTHAADRSTTARDATAMGKRATLTPVWEVRRCGGG